VNLRATFLIAAACIGVAAQGDVADFVSGPGTILYLGAGVALPWLSGRAGGRSQSARALDSLIVSSALAEGVEYLTNSPRPDGGRRGFPSGHATAAFSVASMETAFQPKLAPLWYLGAAWIGESRVELRRHTWIQVGAGAALGYGVSRWELSRPRGIILSPWIDPGSGAVGFSLSRSW
jgi:membrane-associated phospholipid phosphatase